MNYVPVAKKDIKLPANYRFINEATYTAELAKPEPGPGMYRLTLQVGVRLERSYPSPTVFDYDGNEFAILPWKSADWQKFVISAKTQAAMWNNRFWLVPPASVTEYDWPEKPSRNGQKPRRFRPYVACQLDVDFFASRSDADLVIEVYNLDTSKLAGRNFRSDSMHYDAQDGTPWDSGFLDVHGNPIMHFTIAHEIGHAIGQQHIGVMQRNNLCMRAMEFEGPEIGQGKPACYANWGDLKMTENIMGAGGAFTEDNARSWIWAIHMLRGARNSLKEKWTVLTSQPATAGEWQS